MIPKIIHYCWFSKNGSKIPKKYQKFINHWKTVHPDYQIICWNEKNFDVNNHSWTKTAFEAGKFAFVSDYVRLYVLYKYGGIYMDTDVEVIRSFDSLLNKKFILGFEGAGGICTSTMGAQKGALWVKDILNYYEDKFFIINDSYNIELPNPVIVTPIIYQKYPHFLNEVLSMDYLTAKMFDGTNLVTENTVTKHHFDGSWLNFRDRIEKKIKDRFWSVPLFRSGYRFIMDYRKIFRKTA